MVRFGIIGAGSIARKFAKDIQVVPNATLVAVASRTKEKAEIFQKEFSIPHAYGSYQELAESDLVDAVYIATPHSFHKEQTILFLQHNKHVLCEKPIAVNESELNEMIDTAKKHNKVLMEAMWAAFLPANQYALQVIESASMGNITAMDFSFGFDIKDFESQRDNRLLNIYLAGGSLLDVGVYNIAISQFFKKDPIQSIQSTATFFDTGVDLSTDSIITYEDGVVLHTHSAINKELKNDAIITFEKGEMIIPNFWCAESVIINNETHRFPHASDGFEYEIESFVNTIKKNQNENHIMTHQSSRNTLRIVDQIRKEIGLQYPNE